MTRSTNRTEEVSNADQPQRGPVDVDIAVVGAGITGLYTAWKLQKAGRNVKVFEAQDRVGGRLLSIQIPGIPMRAELGAMRYSRNHKRVFKLIEEIIGIAPDTHTFNFQTRYFVRGRYDTSAYYLKPQLQRLDGDSAPTAVSLMCFVILKLLRNITFMADAPSQISTTVKEKILESPAGDPVEFVRDIAKNLTDDEWEHIKRYGQGEDHNLFIPFHSTGFWNALQAILGNEGFQLVHDTFGYESGVGNWNAAEAMYWFTKVVDIDDFYRLPDGYQSLAIGLKNRLNEDSLTLNSRLSELEKLSGDGGNWRLTFEDSAGNITQSMTAHRVILALPRKALEAISIRHDGWKDFADHELTAARPQPAFKIFLIYQSAWWTDYGLPDHFKFVTDIPIRQVYYYGPGWLRRLDRSNSQSLASRHWAMLMCYSDAHYVAFWNAVIGSKDPPYFHEPHIWPTLPEETRDSIRTLLERYGASQRMIIKAQGQLAELHGMSINEIPSPIFGIYKDWGETDPTNAGWHLWEPNYQVSKVRETIHQKFNQHRLYLCNEAYSHDQTWVEGALYSADNVLAQLGVSDSM